MTAAEATDASPTNLHGRIAFTVEMTNMPRRGGGMKGVAMNASALLGELATAAERYVNKAPKQQRLAAERQRLLDLLTRAQLFLSVDKATHKTS